ncbi:MAG TPA: hypothetical protein VIY71_06325 [Solirubrobacterales bacterium]
MQASNSTPARQLGLAVLAAVAATMAAATIFPLVVSGEAGAKASLGGTLSGSTSQGNPGLIRVSSNGRMVKEASLTVSVKCPVGPLPLPQKVRGLSIAPGGRFAGTLEDTSVEEGMTLHLFESFSGKFNADRTKVVAKSRIRLNFQEADGTTETCDSGVVTLRANR